MKLFEFISSPEFLSEENLMEMTNLVKDDTGLKYPIWVGPTDQRHSPRIKVSNFTTCKFSKTECFSVVIAAEPYVVSGNVKINSADLDEVFDWVKTNRTTLEKINDAYNAGTSVLQLLNQLKKL